MVVYSLFYQFDMYTLILFFKYYIRDFFVSQKGTVLFEQKSKAVLGLKVRFLVE